MRTLTVALAAAAAFAGAAVSQDRRVPEGAFEAGRPLGVTTGGVHTPMSRNVKVFGGVVSAESCVYDRSRKLIMVVNRGAAQTEAPNDGFVSLLNHDGSVHTAKWIGATRAGLVLNQPFGSDIHGGRLYLADSDGGTADGAPRVSVVRMFDLRTGAPAGEIRVEESPWFNDIAVARDGSVYATQSGTPDGATPMRIYKVAPDGEAKVLVEGAPLAIPNGIAIDRQGNLVVVNIGSSDVFTFSPAGKLLRTERAPQAGNDGLVIMPDGTKYISSVREGGIQRLRPGRPAELIATGVPSAASMCFDSDANQLVVPMNPNNAVAFVRL
jgi:DNA-binding beta-propeller fold protein YncE